MKLQIIAPAKPEPIYKASIHKTGRLGFTIEAAKQFNVDTSKTMILAINADDQNDQSVYGMLAALNDPNGYKIQKAGKYHSVNAKAFFDEIKYKYTIRTISFVLSNIKVDNVDVIKFTPTSEIDVTLPF